MVKATKWITSDFILLNQMLGGGIPVGHIIEVFGFEGCGKTTFALELSKLFKKPYMIDYEYALDKTYMDLLGVKLAKATQPVTFEEGVDNFFRALKKHKFDCLIVDTIGSAISEAEIEKELKENTMGIRAQKVTVFCKKAEKICKPLGITVILLNHKKDRIGGGFGDKYYTPGGRQIKFSASIRLSVTKKKCKDFPDDGIIMNIWTKKNKVAQNIPFQNCKYVIRRGMGIIRGEETMRLGIEAGVIKIDKQMYKIGSKSFRGKAKLIDFLNSEERVRAAINDKWTSKTN